MSLENLYKRLTGTHPTKGLEPPLIGPALAKEVKRIRANGGQRANEGQIVPTDQKTPEAKSFTVLDSGTDAAGREPFTLIGQVDANGFVRRASFVFGHTNNNSLHPEHISSDDWFEVPPEMADKIQID